MPTYQRLHKIPRNLLYVVWCSVDNCFSGVFLPSLVHLLTPGDLFGPPECHPTLVGVLLFSSSLLYVIVSPA